MTHTVRIVCALALTVCLLPGQQYIVSTIAGGSPPATAAPTGTWLGNPDSLATDAAGNVYFNGVQCIFKVDPNGVLTRVAGTSRKGYSGDGESAAAAQLFDPSGLAADARGNLYIADSGNYRIRRVSPDGTIVTVAGNGSPGFSGDGGAAVAAQFNVPAAIATDSAGNLFVADYLNNRVRKVTPAGLIATVPTGTALNGPDAVASDGRGGVYIADSGNNRVLLVSASGTTTTVAGNGAAGYSGDNGPAARAELNYPDGLALDSAGNLYIADSFNQAIRKVAPNGTITTVAGNGTEGFSGDGGPAASATLAYPNDVAVDPNGNILIADSVNSVIRRVLPGGVIISTLAGSGTAPSGDGGPAAEAADFAPAGLAVDNSGTVAVAEATNNRVRRIATDGIISTAAGNGTSGFSGDGGVATQAQLDGPLDVAVDGAGNLFIADTINNRIRKVGTDGNIATVAGNGYPGNSGLGGPALQAALNDPAGVAVDSSGNLLIADTGSTRILKVAGGAVTALTGTSGQASIGPPGAVAPNPSGILFAADPMNNRIVKVASGAISVVAGNGVAGFSGDGGQAAAAGLNHPQGVAADAAGDLLIADTANNRIRMVSAGGAISTIAGGPLQGYAGDGGPGQLAQFRAPVSVAVDGSGNVLVTDAGNGAIRLLKPSNRGAIVAAVLDAAAERALPVSPGKIVAIYGTGLGPAQLVQASAANGVIGTQLAGTTVSFNGTPAPVIYTSATQVAAIVPYGLQGASAQVTVSYQGQISDAASVPVAPSAPAIFTANATGAGQAAAINAVDGTLNSATNPAHAGDYVSIYATGEGLTNQPVDGRLNALPLPFPNLPVSATVGGIAADIQYAGGVFGVVAGLMQVNVRIPAAVAPGGYVPVTLQVGSALSAPGVWICVQ